MARNGPTPVYTTTAQANGPDIRTLTTASPGATDSTASTLPFAAAQIRESYVRPEQAVAAADATGAVLAAGNAFGWGWLMDPVVVGIVPANTDGFRLLAGTFTLTFHYSRAGGLLTANQNNVVVTAILFRASSTGSAIAELGRNTATVSFTTTEQSATISITTAQTVFEPGQRLYLEMHVSRPAQLNGDQGSAIHTNSTTGTRLTAFPQYERLYNKSLADSAPSADAVARTFSGARALADSAPAADAVTRSVSAIRSLADSAPATDALQRQFTGARSLADSAPAADTLARAATYSRSLADSVPSADAVTRVVAALRSLADSAPAVADTVQRQFTGARALTDASTVTDAIQRAFTGSRTLTDAIPLADAVTRQVTAARSLADAAPAADTLQRAAIFSRSIADSAPAVTDVLQRQFTGARSLQDTGTVADTLQRAATFARDLDDDLSNGATPPAPIVVRTTVMIFDD